MKTSSNLPKNIQPSEVLFVSRQWVARGKNTDFNHVFSWYPGARIVTNENAILRPYFLLKALADHTKRDGYRSLNLGLELAALWEIAKKRPKLVHFLYADSDLHYLGYITRWLKIPLVANFYFSIHEFERRMPHKKFLKTISLITATGRSQKEYLSNFVSPEKIAYLPLGIDTRFFKVPAHNVLRFQQKPVILHVGVNRRDFSTLKRIFLELKSRYPEISFQMVHGAAVKDQFQDLPYVYFHNFLSDEQLLEVYQKASLLLLPLLDGASSQTLNEAMATGLPVVTTDLPILSEYSVGTGIQLCKKGDAKGMVEACINLLENQGFWEESSRLARVGAERFDFSKIKGSLFDIYREKLGLNIKN